MKLRNCTTIFSTAAPFRESLMLGIRIRMMMASWQCQVFYIDYILYSIIVLYLQLMYRAWLPESPKSIESILGWLAQLEIIQAQMVATTSNENLAKIWNFGFISNETVVWTHLSLCNQCEMEIMKSITKLKDHALKIGVYQPTSLFISRRV